MVAPGRTRRHHRRLLPPDQDHARPRRSGRRHQVVRPWFSAIPVAAQTFLTILKSSRFLVNLKNIYSVEKMHELLFDVLTKKDDS